MGSMNNFHYIFVSLQMQQQFCDVFSPEIQFWKSLFGPAQ